MARAKPTWRRVLTVRYLRFALASWAVRALPWLGDRLGFYPNGLDVIAAADRVLADVHDRVDPALLLADLGFLERCLPHDSLEPGVALPDRVETGRRTTLYRRAWIDMTSGSILLPARRRTVRLRSEMNWNNTSIRLGRPRIAVPGRALAPINTAHYFHLLLENGVRILDLMQTGVLGEAPLAIVKPPDRTAVERALYDGLVARHPQLSVRHLPASALAMPDEAVCHFPRNAHREWPPIDRTLAEALAEVFAAVYGPPPSRAGSRLYLSRAGAKLRALDDEEALRATLGAAGFETFVATDANHPEQIARFRAAETVVAVHGAGLTNLVFCRAGTRVIEIFPGNFVKSPFWWLSRQMALDYRPVIGGPGDYDQRFRLGPAGLDEVARAIDAAPGR